MTTPVEIQESDLLRAFMDNATDFIYFKDTESRFIRINQTRAKGLGLNDPTEAIGKTDLDFFSPEHFNISRADELRVMQTGQPLLEEKWEDWGDGQKRWISTTKLPLRDRDGKIIGIFGITRDITERRQIEAAALQASENRFHDIVMSLSDWIWEVDSQGRYTYCSGKITNVLGYTAEEVLGKTPFDLMPPEEAARITPIFGEIITHKRPIVDLENQNIHKDGRIVYLLTNGVPILNAAGDLTGYRGVDKDITERKQAEAEREHLQQEIIEAQQHAIRELSTPVIPIMDRIIVMPLIGSIDSLRARDVTRNLLAGISQHRAKVVILDITGVNIMDTGVVNHLNKTIQAARLKGARTIVTGMSDAVAEAIVDLGIDWSGVQTLSNLQTGLMAALATLGLHIEADPK